MKYNKGKMGLMYFGKLREKSVKIGIIGNYRKASDAFQKTSGALC